MSEELRYSIAFALSLGVIVPVIVYMFAMWW